MKKLVFLACLIMGQQIHAQVPSDTAQWFDFWIGEWIAKWDEGDGAMEYGKNSVRNDLDGRVLREHFEITAGKSAGF
jgi:hypothetical protein